VRIPHTKYHLGPAHLRELATLAVVQRFGKVLKKHHGHH
jgi:hypothetical protein